MLARRHVPVLGKQDLRPFQRHRNFNQFFRLALNLRNIGHAFNIFQVRPLQVQYVAEPQARFDLLVKTGAETPQKQENATL